MSFSLTSEIGAVKIITRIPGLSLSTMSHKSILIIYIRLYVNLFFLYGIFVEFSTMTLSDIVVVVSIKNKTRNLEAEKNH